MAFSVMMDCPEGYQLVGDRWETRWIRITWRILDSLSEAERVVAGLEARHNPQMRNIQIDSWRERKG